MLKSDYDATIPGAWRLQLYDQGGSRLVNDNVPVDPDGSFIIQGIPPDSAGYQLKVEGTVTNHVTPLPESAVFKMAYGQQKTVDLLLEKKWYATIFAGTRNSYGIAEGGVGTAKFSNPGRLTFLNNSLYVANMGSNSIMAVDINSGYATILVQNGGVYRPWSILPDGAGNLLVSNNDTSIDKVTLGGSVTNSFVTGLSNIGSFAIANNGYLFIADYGAHNIKRVSSSGGAAAFFIGGNGSTDTPPKFKNPIGIMAQGDFLYVLDHLNHAIRKVHSTTGVTTTLAGELGVPGANNGTGVAAHFTQPISMALDGAGTLYVTSNGSTTIRKIDIATGKVSTITIEGPGSPIGNYSYGLCVVNGNIYVTSNDHCMRKLTRDWP
jgi:sugar lactone lactonase YvrE